MKLVSWNVNGIRACVRKGFYDFFRACDADVFCIQETKMQKGDAELVTPGYDQYLVSAVRKGYSGVMMFTRKQPLSVIEGLGVNEFDQEGRALTLEFDTYYVVGCYSPNAQPNLVRLDYRMRWEDALRSYVQQLNTQKPVILCGDLNVAHTAMDLKHPQRHQNSAGYSEAERAKFTELLNTGFIDTFRWCHPDQIAYTWWDYRFHARKHNAGWRIDYVVASKALKDQIVDAQIHAEILGSDHCPISLKIQ